MATCSNPYCDVNMLDDTAHHIGDLNDRSVPWDLVLVMHQCYPIYLWDFCVPPPIQHQICCMKRLCCSVLLYCKTRIFSAELQWLFYIVNALQKHFVSSSILYCIWPLCKSITLNTAVSAVQWSSGFGKGSSWLMLLRHFRIFLQN